MNTTPLRCEIQKLCQRITLHRQHERNMNYALFFSLTGLALIVISIITVLSKWIAPDYFESSKALHFLDQAGYILSGFGMGLNIYSLWLMRHSEKQLRKRLNQIDLESFAIEQEKGIT